MERIEILLETLKQGGTQSHLNLTIIPLLAPDAGEPDYLILEEALAKSTVEVTEISEGGTVPEIKVINKSSEKLLVVDGEELVGAKQNRVVNATFLIAGNAQVNIPVSCVEQGRWSYRTARFHSGQKIMPPSLKREHQTKVTANLAMGIGYHSDQGMIWDELAERSARMQVKSTTGAMADLFDGQKDRLSEYLKVFRLADCQVGALFAINDEVVGLECFGHQQTFSKFFQKLIQSYALDALDWPGEEKEGQVPAAAVRRFLEGVRRAPKKAYPSLGLGENVRVQGPFVSGAALVQEGRVLHLSAFSHPGQRESGTKVPFQRFSQRRRR
jgi:hypothetical protein